MIIKNEDIINSIGKKIKKARLDKGFTQNSLSEKIDISTDLLRNIENGRNIGSIATLLNLCNALEITPDFLFSDFLEHTDKQIDNNLYCLFEKVSPADKEVFKQIIIYLDNKYNK